MDREILRNQELKEPPSSAANPNTVSYPSPGLITLIPAVRKHQGPNDRFVKSAAVARSSSEKEFVPQTGILYDSAETEFITGFVAGRQVNVGDMVAPHNTSARLVELWGDKDKDKEKALHSLAGELMGWKSKSRSGQRPGSAPATRKSQGADKVHMGGERERGTGPVIPPKRNPLPSR